MVDRDEWRRAWKRRSPVALVAGVIAGLLATTATAVPAAGRDTSRDRWQWPLDSRVVAQPFQAPAHRYGAGHRGVDLGGATGVSVKAPADGVVAYVGVVVDRPLVTIDHGDGYVSTLEPVDSDLAPGVRISRGDIVGGISTGGHTAAGELHLGVRLDGEYINPLGLLGGVRRAILLPCC